MAPAADAAKPIKHTVYKGDGGLAGVDTLFMPTNPEYSFLASSLVKEIAKWGGDVSSLVPPLVLKRLAERGQS